jgi:hypothetical protein
MEEPKKLWIGAEWQAERDHYGLDKRCGMFSTERFNEDDKGYVPADLTDALVEAAKKAVSVAEITGGKVGIHVVRELRAALAALKAMEES